MSPLIDTSIVLASMLAMEGVTWASHKYIMHGFGWAWHRDHHEPHDGLLEKNDLYAVFYGALSISMFALGSPLARGKSAWAPGTWIGFGILFYGVIYMILHDVVMHQRYFRWVPKSGYGKRLVQAHRLHHAMIGKGGGVSFNIIFARHPAVLKRELAEQVREGRVKLRDGAL